MTEATWTERALLGSMEWVGKRAMRDLDRCPPGATGSAADPGSPVVVVGGFAATAPVMAPLAEGLAARGHDVRVVVEGAAAGCARRATDSLVREVEALAVRHGRPVHLVGHSRGGQFARVATARVPHSVASLTTLGTPFALYGLGPVALGIGGAVAVAGSLGVPGLATLTCLLGDCCRSYRDDLVDPWAADVPYTTITGTDDRTVPRGRRARRGFGAGGGARRAPRPAHLHPLPPGGRRGDRPRVGAGPGGLTGGSGLPGVGRVRAVGP